MKQKLITGLDGSSTDTSTLRRALTAGIRQSAQVVTNPMQPPASSAAFTLSNSHSNPGTIIPDTVPSLDENLLNILAADGDDDPMLSPSAANSFTNSTSSLIDTSIVLPNTVFSSKPVSQDMGFLQLMSSGRSTVLKPTTEPPKQLLFQLTDGSVSLQRPGAKGKSITGFALPQSSQQGVFKSGITLSGTSGNSSQALLVSTSRDSKIIRMPFTRSPASEIVYSKPSFDNGSVFTTTAVLSSSHSNTIQMSKPVVAPVSNSSSSNHSVVSNQSSFSSISSPTMSESFLPADISFTSESSRDSLAGLPSDAVTLTIEDLLSYTKAPVLSNGTKSEPTKSDRESDLTSPGSVRSAISEMDSSLSRSEDMDAVEKLACHYPNCGKTFERANLLKRHLKMHSGECR